MLPYLSLQIVNGYIMTPASCQNMRKNWSGILINLNNTLRVTYMHFRQKRQVECHFASSSSFISIGKDRIIAADAVLFTYHPL